VFVGYLALGVVSREVRYRGRNYVVFGLVLIIVLAVFAWRVIQARNLIGGWAIPSARDAVHIGLTVVAYFGAPLIILGLLGPILADYLPLRIRLFLICIGVIPLMELAVIAWLNIVNVTWYYAMIAMVGLALLAAAALIGLWRRGYHGWSKGIGAASIAYSLAFLQAYHLFWHGDRPRWEEAARFVETSACGSNNSEVYAGVSDVVAYYLAADPLRGEWQQRVKPVPTRPPEIVSADAWFVVEAKCVSAVYQDWFDRRCILRARFDSLTGPVDRSVLVYQIGK